MAMRTDHEEQLRSRFSYLVVLELPPDDSEGGVDEMVVDVDLGESVRRPRRAPLLLLVVVDHDGGARGGDALLRSLITEKEDGDPVVIFYQQTAAFAPLALLPHTQTRTSASFRPTCTS